MALRGGLADYALKQQQIQQSQANTADIQAQAQQRQKDLGDQNTLQQMLADPDHPEYATKAGQGDFSFTNGILQPKTTQALNENAAKLHQTLLTNTKQQNDIAATALKKLQDGVNGLYDIGKNPDGSFNAAAVNEQLPNFIQEGMKDGLFKDAGITPPSTAAVQSQDDLDKVSASLRMLGAAREHVSGLQKEQAATAASTASAGKDVADAAKANADAAFSNFKLNIAKNGMQPGAIESTADSLADRSKFPEANNAMRVAGRMASASGDPEKVQQAMSAIYDKMVVPNLASTAQGAAQKAKAEAQATAPIHQAEAVAVANANRAGAEHVAAQGDYEKSIKDLNTSAADAQRLHNLIAAAQGGNKAAPALVPIAELRGFLNRINQTELRSVSSQAGSYADRVEGFLKGATEGQPVPPDILQATDQLASLQTQQAEQKHAGEVTAINLARNEKLQPVTAVQLGYKGPQTTAAAPVPAALKAQFPNDAFARDPSGKLHHAPKGQALPAGWAGVN
jgi:hypothetical protein